MLDIQVDLHFYGRNAYSILIPFWLIVFLTESSENLQSDVLPVPNSQSPNQLSVISNYYSIIKFIEKKYLDKKEKIATLLYLESLYKKVKIGSYKILR